MANEAAKPQLETGAREWQRLRELLADVLELPVQERRACLDRVCAGDSSLRARLEELIAAHDATNAAGFDLPAFSLTSSQHDPAEARQSVIGRRIGAYRIEAEIARGGMGTVFRAVRADDEYQKQVAIKLVSGAAFSSHAAEMFRRERQVLASLEHTNIARLLDGGTTEDGSPFLVMEYVEGEQVTTYCNSHSLPLEGRLKLFQKICSAVHYAHQNLVIHRDIKPGNILVTEAGEPKLLDFGIAKIIAIDAAGEATFTSWQALTPAYASPEQVSGAAITTATDTYSLGLVLYELLAGGPPFAANLSPLLLQKQILEREPDLPSKAAIQKLAESPSESDRTSREKLARQLIGDLDCIVVKALRKEPAERYSSTAQFSEDIERYLQRQPVLARRPTLMYQLGKFLKRHAAGALTASFIFLLLVAGAITIVRAERKAKAQQALAEKRFNDVRRMANSLLFEVHDSIWNVPGTTAARQLIVQRAQEYLDTLSHDAKTDPELMRELATAYSRLGDVMGNGLDANMGNSEQALRSARKAAELRQTVAAMAPSNVEDQWRLAQSYMDIAHALSEMGKKSEQDEYLDKAVAILQPLAASNSADRRVQYEYAKACERKGTALGGEGKLEEAKTNYAKSLNIYQALSEAKPENENYASEVAVAHKHLGGILILQRDYPGALKDYRAALAIDEEQLRADPKNSHKLYNITFTYSDLGYILGRTGDINGALSYYHKAFDIRASLVGLDPLDARARGGLANTHNYIARLLWRQEKLDEALEHEKQAYSIRKALSDADSSNDRKRLDKALSEASIGETYAKLAFSQHASGERRAAFCKQAQSWLDEAIPFLQPNGAASASLQDRADDLREAEQALRRCKPPLKIP